MVPHVADSFADLLDPRFQKIYNDAFPQLNDMLPELFTFEKSNGRNNMTFSEVSGYGDIGAFSNTVSYQSASQGYDTTITPIQYASGIQVERALFDDDQYNIMNQRPAGLARATQRTRQKFGARVFNNAFSVDTKWNNNTEAVAMCSNSHTTTTEASTASGFDNLTTSALSATAVAAMRIQMRGFRDSAANRIDVEPNEMLIPPDLYEEAYEIVESMGKVDQDTNNRNVHKGRYTIKEWNYLTDTNNWFMMDSALRGDALHWLDRISAEMAMVEDFDTLIAKWRIYFRLGNGHSDWRFICGASVS